VGNYQSPGVYVEEVELGAKPIEGVATNVAGTVGVTVRGPENVPVLITSFPQFTRIFGGYLDSLANPSTWFMPHSVEGFFQNGGQVIYPVKIAAEAATYASVTLMDRGAPTAYASHLVMRAQRGDIFALLEDTTGLAAGSWLRIDDGAGTEYVKLATAPFPVPAAQLQTLRASTYFGYALNTLVTELPAIAAVGAAVQLTAATPVAANQIQLTAVPGGLVANDVLRIQSQAPYSDEFAIVETVPTNPADTTITLRGRLAIPHANNSNVDVMAENAPGPTDHLSQGVAQGSSLLVLNNGGIAAGTVVRLGGAPSADAQAGYYTIAQIRTVTLLFPAFQDHADGEVVTEMGFAAAGYSKTLEADSVIGATTIRILNRTSMAPGDWIQISPGVGAEFAQVAALPTAPADAVQLHQPLRRPHAQGDQVLQQNMTPGNQTTLLEDVSTGSRAVLLADNDAQFAPAAMVAIGPAGATSPEYGPLDTVLAPVLVELDQSTVPPNQFTAGHSPDAAAALRAPLFDLRALDRGEWGNQLWVTVKDENPPLVQTTSAGAPAANPVPLASTSGIEPGALLEILDFATQLTAVAPAGASTITVNTFAGLVTGDILRVDRNNPEFVTVATNPTTTSVAITQPLARAHGIREWVDRMDPSGQPKLGKVAHRQGANQVIFDGGGLGFPVPPSAVVRSREFQITVQWLKPVNGGRSRLVESETYRYLSLDDRHSRYVGTILGSTTGPLRLWDRRTEGQSDMVRVVDPASSDQTETELRLGPDLIYETLPSGRVQPVARELSGGDDQMGSITDADYIGVDDVDPLNRTGLYCLKSQEDISLVAIPGRVSELVQGELINHCELMRYRVAFLDSVPGANSNGAAIPAVQAQRQQFDSKYAALYYPWLLVDNPFVGAPLQPTQISVPPSLHVIGICARTDVTRGVHKAPANEVIAGIAGLQRSLTKGEQDVLNPSPMNVNALMDFRLHERGLRVWGARVITSDEEWKYLNIRRLFNFVERSLELGTQWVVFEPNDPNLWARVRATIRDFLNGVWRSGGLFGVKPEQAYFVKCDESNNPPSERENGRLNILVGIAPVFPAEFVIIQIGQWQGGSSVTEG
jgi:Bacteriophage tail sheath protein